MKKIIVISDTHGTRKGIEKLRPLIAENDYVIHLGDGAMDMREIMDAYPDKVYIVLLPLLKLHIAENTADFPALKHPLDPFQDIL